MIKPWITPYADERYEGRFGFDGSQIFFAEGLGEPRDEHGVLWQPAPDLPTGPVNYAEMHTGRQRAAMLGPLCQVCGCDLAQVKPWLWLLPNLELRVRRPNGRPFTTNTPPICATCVDLAREQCPNLRALRPTLLLQVRHFRLWGVFGDYVNSSGRLAQGDVRFGAPEIPRTMARHLVVQIFDYRTVRS